MILEIPKLTKYQPGSLKELTAISLPLMITALSTTFMQFFDRVILAQCSLDAMNAAASLGMVCAIFQYMGAGITGIAEVFVGQAYGAQQNHKISDPVWQMIWFSLMLIPLFVLITVIGEPYIVPQNLCEQGTGFFRWMMPTSFLLPITAAVAAFFDYNNCRDYFKYWECHFGVYACCKIKYGRRRNWYCNSDCTNSAVHNSLYCFLE
jgi:MATE family multidrug resistance protein